MPFFTNKKEGKQNKVMILVEPSIEEEQQAPSSHSVEAKQKAFGRQLTTSDTDFQHHFLNENRTNVISSSKLLSSASTWQKRNESEDTYKVQLQSATTTSPTSTSKPEKITTAKSTVFNLTVPSFQIILTNKLPSESINESDKKTNSSLTALNETKTTPNTSDQASVTTLEPSSINETNNSLGDTAASTATSDESLMVGGEEEDDDSERKGEGDKLNKLMLETASELADHLVERIRSPSLSLSNEESISINEDELADMAEQPAEMSGESSSEDIRRCEDKSGGSANNQSSGLTRDTANNESVAPGSFSKTELGDDKSLKFAFETYDKWRTFTDDLVELFSKKVLPILIENGYDVDAVTATGMLQVFNGIRGIKPWALKLLDSWTKISPGILVGTQSDFGDFDECLNVRIDDPSGLSAGTSDDILAEVDENTGLKVSTVVGRYCLADVEFPKPPRVKLATRNVELGTDYAPIELRRPLLNFSQSSAFKDTIFVETGNFFHMLYVDPLRVGICLTNKIDPESFEKVFNKLLDEFKVIIRFRGRCVTKYDKTAWTSYQKVSAYVIVIACCLVIISTILDLTHTKLNKIPMPMKFDKWKMRTQEAAFKIRPLFTSFSLIRNTKRLFKPQMRDKISVSGGGENSNYLVTDSSASSSECSPSIERRSSTTGSAVDLISAPSSLSKSTQSNGNNSYNEFAGSVGENIKTSPVSSVQFDSTPSNHLEVKRASQECNLLCLHGIRVITMTWMIVNHTYLFGGFFVLWAHRRLIDIAEWPKSLSFQLVLNGWLTVETYFFLSAAIIVLNVLPMMKSRKFSYVPYIFHRLVRLLPAYIGLVCLNFLWPLISSGPVWLVKGKSFIQTPCENYLWTNFLFVNNWIWPEKQCMVHTWFLSADFQLYLLAPIIVYLLCRQPVYGHSLNIAVAVFASIFSGFVIYANKLMPTTLINRLEFDSIKQQLSYSYFATYQHMGPYCLGLFIGYLLHNRPHVKLPKHLTWCLWLLLPPLSFTTLLLTYLWNGAYDEPNLINPSPLVSAFYVAIHRTIWTSLVAWIVFACTTGRAKLMSNFLSHSMFIPLSRLSFSIYLVHLPIIMFRALNLRHTVEWTDSNILWEACGNFIASILVGYFVNVVFESPFINLETVIFRRGRSLKDTKSVSDDFRAHSNNHIAYNGYNVSRLGKRLLSQNGELMKNKNSLQPAPNSSQSTQETLKTSSEQNSSSDSDDNRTTIAQSSNQHTSVSSPEQGRKLTSANAEDDTLISRTSAAPITKSVANLERDSPRHMRWTGREYQGSLKVKAFPPKQTSTVGELLDSHHRHQVEPPVQLHYDPKLPLQSVDSITGAENSGSRLKQSASDKTKFAPPPVERIRKQYPAFYEPPSLESSTTIDDSMYPITGGYQHYARAGFQQHLHQNSRPSQYATLARTSEFNHNSNSTKFKLKANNVYIRLPYPGANVNSDSRIYLTGEPISRQSNQYRMEASYLMRQRAQLFQRTTVRQGRYNTLTGDAGSIRQWRKQYERNLANNEDDVAVTASSPTWQPPFWSEQTNSQPDAQSTSSGGNSLWLKSVNIIPRVDLSTLRSLTNRPIGITTGSIVEEAAHEEEDEEQNVPI